MTILAASLFAIVAVICVLAIMAALAIILFHQFAPEKEGWLSEEQQKEIYVGIKVIGGGIVGGLSLMSAQFIQKLVREKRL